MSLAAAAHGRPSAPQNGMYHRMEDQDYTQRFKNLMRMQLFGDTAVIEFPRHKTKKSHNQRVLRRWSPARIPAFLQGPVITSIEGKRVQKKTPNFKSFFEKVF